MKNFQGIKTLLSVYLFLGLALSQTAPTDAPAAPTTDAANVVSLFSDAYTDLTGTTWNPNWGQSTVVADTIIAGNTVKRYSGFNYSGIEPAATINGSAMQSFKLDYWTSDATVLKVKFRDYGADGAYDGGDDVETELEVTPGLEGWHTLNIPIANFVAAGLTTSSNIGQIVLSSVATNPVFLDNMYFISSTEPVDAPATPTADAANVVSLFSDAYTDLTGTTWNPNWGQSTVVADTIIAGNTVKRYSGFNYSGIEPAATINGSAMTHFTIDYWTSDATALNVKFVDYGSDDAWGADNIEVEISNVPVTSSWGTLSISIADFVAAGLTTSSNIGQIVLSAVGATNPVFLDNMYFYSSSLPTEPTTAPPSPTENAANVASLFSDAYTDLTGTTWNPNWGQTTTIEDVTIAGNTAKKYSNFTFSGIEPAATINGSAMTYFTLDYWTSDADTLKVKFRDYGADGAYDGGDDVELELNFQVNSGAWNTLNIPMAAFVDSGLTTSSNIGQIVLSAVGATNPVFLDNIYFRITPTAPTDAPAAPTADAANVVSLYSDAYTDLAGTTWNPNWGQTTTIEDVTIAGNTVKKYSNFTFSGIEPAATINGSVMQSFTLDYWTSDADTLKVKFRDYGADGAYDGGDDVETELEIASVLEGWHTVNIPITDFVAGGLTTSSNIGQIVLSAVGATNPVFLDNIYFRLIPTVALVINDFNTLESATDEGAGAFWVEFDESESAQNYSTLIQIPADQAPDSDSPVMSWSWGTDGDQGWGGYTSVYHVYDAAVDMSDFNYLSFKFRNSTQPANLGSMAFRVNLFDVSDATAWQTRDDTEVWYSFFEGEANSPFYNVADDGWVEYRIPLQESGSTGGGTSYTLGFTRTGWVGISGNNAFDKDKIGGFSIEVVQAGVGETNYGEFFLEDIRAIYSADLPGCMDPNSCNYNPDATVDDGSCYDCVDVTFNLDMSSIPTYTESDIPYLAGGAFFGAPGSEDYALSYNPDLSVDGHVVFSKTVQLQENTTFGYTYTKDGNADWSGKENIVGQDCAVGTYSDREMTTSTNDTTITACYGTCTDNEFCPAFDLIDVTFSVNMQYEDVDETGVFLHGSWFAWGTMAMSDDDANGVYEITIPDMTSGSIIEFKFMNGADVEIVPADCDNINDWGGGINRMYTLPETDTTIGPICFGGCVDCAPAGPVDVTFNLDMSGVDGFDGTEAPYVFGSFNNWDSFGGQTMLADEDGDNVYTGTVDDLMSDAEITLLFGYGANYETVPEECGILDSDLNLYVRLLPLQDAGGSDVLVLDAIPYGGCPTGPPVSSAQFTVDVSTVVSTFPEGYQVCVTGEFDGWSGWGAVLTDDDGDMVYTGTRSDLVAGTDYQYKFVINGWDSGIEGGAPLGSECDFLPTDEFNNYGFTAVEGLLDLDEVCWGACVTCDLLSNEESSDNVMPAEFSYKMFPNPFNPYINIYYELPVSELVTITIMNLLGQEVKTIVNKVHQPGRYSNSWDGKDSYGQVLQSGIYFAVINRQSGRAVSKITFLK